MKQDDSRIKVVKGLEIKKTINLSGKGREDQADVYDIWLKIPAAKGKIAGAQVTLVYEPQSGFSWWNFRYQTIHDRTRATVDPIARLEKNFMKVSDHGISAFTADGASLSVWEHRKRYKTADEALSAVRAIMESHAAQIEGGSFQWMGEVNAVKTIDLRKILGNDFCRKKDDASPQSWVKIINVTLGDSGWIIDLDGANGNKARFHIGTDLGVIKALLNGKLVFPK